MNNEEIQWIKSCLPSQISYSYYKDLYALDLLQYCFEDGTKIQDIKKSKLGGLLNKPIVKQIVQQCGNGKLDMSKVEGHWEKHPHVLKLTLDEWGSISKRKGKTQWDQVSRPEKNLVLQVNFGSEHKLLFNKKLGENNRDAFERHLHPIHAEHYTLGWIRLDINIEHNELLIEEIQADWTRDVLELYDRLNCTKSCCTGHWIKPFKGKFEAYMKFLNPYIKIKDEMLLAAALHFTKCELGIDHVWYHSNQSNIHYKLMKGQFPPKSVYQQLPKKFGFSKTTNKPRLIQDCSALEALNKKGKNVPFYHLKLGK